SPRRGRHPCRPGRNACSADRGAGGPVSPNGSPPGTHTTDSPPPGRCPRWAAPSSTHHPACRFAFAPPPSRVVFHPLLFAFAPPPYRVVCHPHRFALVPPPAPVVSHPLLAVERETEELPLPPALPAPAPPVPPGGVRAPGPPGARPGDPGRA